MLAVVEHEECAAVCQRLRECLDRWDVVRQADTQRARRHLRHQPRVYKGRQFDEPHPVRVVVHRCRRDLCSQARLADTAQTDEREQSTGDQQPLQVGHLSLAPDEARQQPRQIVLWRGRKCRRVRRRKPWN